MTTLSDRKYVLGYVHLHDDVEVGRFRDVMKKLKIICYDDWDEVPEGKKLCDNCGCEVRDHEGQECPT